MPGIGRLQGIRESKKRLQDLKKRVSTGIDQSLDTLVSRLKSQAVLEAPYKSGRLEKETERGISRSSRNSIKINIRARNPKTGYNYAGLQHESLKFRHRKGKAKFVEDPLKRLISDFERNLRESGRLK